MKYELKSGYITTKADSTTLENAMEEADKWCSYNQANLIILCGGEEIARRTWHGSSSDIEEQKDPIDFGTFGYYGDWEIIE